MILAIWWSIGLGAILFGLVPNVWWWIQGHNPFWLAKNCGWRPTTWLLVYLPSSHLLATWSRPLVILEPLQLSNYDILIGQQTLYPFGVGLDNLIKEAWIQHGWSTGDGCKELIHVAFGAAPTIAPLSKVFGCGAFVDTLPYDFVLLEESLTFMGSVEDQREMTHEDELVCHPKNPFHSWRDSPELLRRCEDIILSLSPLRHRSYRIAHRRWHVPLCGVR